MERRDKMERKVPCLIPVLIVPSTGKKQTLTLLRGHRLWVVGSSVLWK